MPKTGQVITMPDVILLNELTDRINELNSDLESDINAINSNVTTVGSSLSSKIDALGTDLSASVNTVKTATATNNTASLTGTLSQKLSYIANSLIGTTNATGGTATTGTVMAKLNKLLKKELTNFAINTISSQASTTAATEKKVLTLSNVLLYGAHFYAYSANSTYYAYVYLTIDGTKYTGNISNGNKYWDFQNDITGVNGMTLVAKSTDIKEAITLDEPIYVESLTVSVKTYQASTTNNGIEGRIYYKQL